jgi:hypothetical protein
MFPVPVAAVGVMNQTVAFVIAAPQKSLAVGFHILLALG